MNLVVDTNIVFGALLNANNSMVEILMKPDSPLVFYTPDLLRMELERYEGKLVNTSKLDKASLTEATSKVLARIKLISEDLISETAWRKAYEPTRNIDEDDTPFVVLAIDLKTKIWTGDKKLVKGLIGQGSNIAVTSCQL